MEDKRSGCRQCMRSTPWFGVLSLLLLVIGLIIWAVSMAKLKTDTMAVGQLMGASSTVLGGLGALMTTAILALSISAAIIIALAIVLAVMRTTQRSKMWGGCCCNMSQPEPWTLRAYQVINVIINFLMWLVMAGSVLLLMAMLMWFAIMGSLAVGIRDGMAEDIRIMGSPLSITRAQDAAAAFQGTANALVAALPVPPELSALMSAATTSSQPFCSPVCINFGSLARVLSLSSSCLCDSKSIIALGLATAEAAKAAAGGLIGAALLFLGSSWLTMVLTAHYVHAMYDRASARTMKQQRAAADMAVYGVDDKGRGGSNGALAVPPMVADLGASGGGMARV